MMCIADSLETRQKDCSLSSLGYAEHVKNKVVSYGNRLICDWNNDKARFRWGGSNITGSSLQIIEISYKDLSM